MILSLFPSLLTYQMIGIFIIRIALSLTFLRLGYRIAFHLQLKKSWLKSVGWVAMIVGLLLLIGLYTQAAALLAALMMLSLVVREIRHRQFDNLNYHLLVLVIALALLTLGPGAFAIDLPL